uniref:[histone H4]-lysine(20) N-methyltransferase n=1 Tax=Clastoptera arizonana TaxID=38151 RepID=A0A1B6CKF3_9HEMI
MVKARKKGSTCKSKPKPEHTEENEKHTNLPLRNGSKTDYIDRLPHSNYLPMVKITKFFSVQVPSSNAVCENNLSPTRALPLNSGRTSPRKHASTCRVVLQQANSVLNKSGEKKDVKSPHKIEMLQPESPSYGLSKLSLQSPKRPLKCKRRLNIQASNQLSLLPLAPSIKEANTNHKLTDYFPVRRSVRKTKKTVLEERQRIIEDAIISGCEEGLEIHIFEGKGRGIVATRNFNRGEFVVEYAGELINIEEAREREQFYAQDQNTGCYMYYFKHHNIQYCIDATPESDRLGRLVNHSRNGNLLTKTVVIKNKPHLVLLAKDNIQLGEEVTYDYGDRSKQSLIHHPWLAT